MENARDFHIFDHSLTISSHRIPPITILCSFIEGHSASKSLGKVEGVDEDSNKKRKVRSQKSDVPHTNSSMYFFL